MWLAQDTSLNRKIALKFPSPVLERDAAARKRFLREAQSAAALDHPYICSIHEVADVDGKLFIAMEYVEGKTLKDLLSAGALPLPRILDIASEIVQALVRAHTVGIVHRDLKPSNIMLTSDGHVKVMDFGLAKRLTSSDSETASATEKSATFGTLAYMSPEQVRGQEVDARSDIFTLGLILHEMAAGSHPFARTTGIECANAILNGSAPPLSKYRKEFTGTLESILSKMLAKNPNDRYASAAEIGRDIDKCRNQTRAVPGTSRRYRWIAVAAAVAVIAAIPLYSYVQTTRHVRWARDEAIPEIGRLVAKEDFTAAFGLASQAQQYIPVDASLKALWPSISHEITIHTDPAGAEVSIKDYQNPAGEWRKLGPTPIDKLSVPFGFQRVKIEKDGYEPVERAMTLPATLTIKLDVRGSIPAEMVRVAAESSTALTLSPLTGIDPVEQMNLPGFLIDRYEVTNREYKKFVVDGGYRRREFWKEPFVKDGRSLSWEQAMSEFRDKHGRPGPSTWELGDYPQGQDDFPVSGVSWYEAQAYAQYAGKSLPTVHHWVLAAGTNANKYFEPIGRFGGSGPRAVHSSQALGPFGTYDMAGNVREWCSNSFGEQRYILGAAWNDEPYLFAYANLGSPFDRQAGNGFRTVKYDGSGRLSLEVTGPIEFVARDYSKEKPVSDEIFQIYKKQFDYDKTPLDAKVESRDDSKEHWITEKVSFRSAYGDERVIVYLTIPKGGPPPYQPVFHYPGSSAIVSKVLDAPGDYDYLVRSGRVLVSVVFKGTFERNDGIASTWPSKTHGYSEYVIKWVKDFRRTVDYLETRNEIDTKHIGYIGTSWGGRMGAIIPAVEDRVRASVIVLAGLAAGRANPEVDQINYIGHIRIPVLMLNGKYDSVVPINSAQIPMFKMWGTPEADKKHVVYESTGHSVPRNEYIKETLNWFDKYLGPVK